MLDELMRHYILQQQQGQMGGPPATQPQPLQMPQAQYAQLLQPEPKQQSQGGGGIQGLIKMLSMAAGG
jgi:hypothetical protein